MNWNTLWHNLGNVVVVALGSIAAFDWTTLLSPELAGVGAIVVAGLKFVTDVVRKGFAGAFGQPEA